MHLKESKEKKGNSLSKRVLILKKRAHITAFLQHNISLIEGCEHEVLENSPYARKAES